jgi:catechol 2,3-dioxygenase-like lactoylglutathione lyase family enzyme
LSERIGNAGTDRFRSRSTGDFPMRTFVDAKAMARSLRDSLAAKAIAISHSDALELVSAQFEAADWNVLSAQIEAAAPAKTPLARGDWQLRPAIPVIRIFDIDKAMGFYRDYLEFKVDWEHTFGPGMPLYLQVSRGDCILHLTEHHGDATPGSCSYVWMTGIDAFHTAIRAKQYPLRPGIEDFPEGARTVQVLDPFGNRLRFSERNGA